MVSAKAFANDVEIQWCPGCPNFGILEAFKRALETLGKAPHEVCLVSGIGQAAKLPHYLQCNFFAVGVLHIFSIVCLISLLKAGHGYIEFTSSGGKVFCTD